MVDNKGITIRDKDWKLAMKTDPTICQRCGTDLFNEEIEDGAGLCLYCLNRPWMPYNMPSDARTTRAKASWVDRCRDALSALTGR